MHERLIRLTVLRKVFSMVNMRAREVMAELRRRGCTERPAKGSHVRFKYGPCATTVPNHAGDLAPGTVRGIERDMVPVFGEGWLTGGDDEGEGE